VKLSVTKDRILLGDGTQRYRDWYFDGQELPQVAKWASWGADNAGMKNMPSPFKLNNPSFC